MPQKKTTKKIKTTKKPARPILAMLLRCRTVGGIIRLMKRFKITGIPGDIRYCPLANYARKCGVRGARVGTGGCHNASGKEVFLRNKVRAAFVEKFDSRSIPELLA